jgi:Mg2+-importing ATPase
MESMATQILVIFIIRTNGRPWADLPRPILTATSLTALLVAMVLPFTPMGAWFGFVPPPASLLAAIAAIAIIYLIAAELVKPFALAGQTRRRPPARHRSAPARSA